MIEVRAPEMSSVDGYLLRAQIGIKKGVICVCAKIIFRFQTLEMTERPPPPTPNTHPFGVSVCEHASVVVCAGVAVVSRGCRRAFV